MSGLGEITPAQRRKRQRTRSMEISVTQGSQAFRKAARSKLRRNPYKAVHFFKRTANIGSGAMNTSAGAPTLIGFSFTLSQLPSYTEFQALYDDYMITGIKFTAIPYLQTDSNSVSGITSSSNPPIFYVVDTNDGSAPGTLDTVLEYNDHKMSPVYQGFSIYFRPKFQDATQALRGGWISTSNPTLAYHGLKVAIPPTANANKFYVTITYYMRFKNPK